ncbi:hypothetical protein IEQ34_026345 [Dendrobium chrysotoxum]|uniref:Uncharacterized protein n=1 Tax=Dendrobium chrysotoxum TaxID=161865 RepID=A0AAV7FMS1_DENCH|nr:hypothetical protein IEQ34_026345 [Dendrobium chrysotoxum]
MLCSTSYRTICDKFHGGDHTFRHLGHCSAGRVFCWPALAGHAVCTGGTMQLNCKHNEVIIGIFDGGPIAIPVRKLCCRYKTLISPFRIRSTNPVGTSPMKRL